MSQPFEPSLSEAGLRAFYEAQLNDLIARFAQAGFTVQLETEHRKPFAMGNYRQRATVHYANRLYRRQS